MARYKIIDRSPRFLPVALEAQLMSGSFEYGSGSVRLWLLCYSLAAIIRSASETPTILTP